MLCTIEMRGRFTCLNFFRNVHTVIKNYAFNKHIFEIQWFASISILKAIFEKRRNYLRLKLTKKLLWSNTQPSVV